MGDSNTIHLGGGAQAKQVAAGQNISQTLVEKQIVIQNARRWRFMKQFKTRTRSG